MAQALAIRFTVFRWTIWFKLWTRLVIYPMSGNNATLKIDFTDPRKRSFVRSFLYTGSEMIHLPWINVRRINLSKKFSRSSRPVFSVFAKFTGKHLCWILFLTKLLPLGAQVFFCEFAKFLKAHFLWSTPCGCF